MSAPTAAVAVSRAPYGPLGPHAAASLPHDAVPSLHLHRFVHNPFFAAPTHTRSIRPPVSSCGLLPGQSWPAFYSYFQSLQRSHAARGTGIRLKTLYLLRHAEGTHNVAESTYGTAHWEAVEALKDEHTDPDLTDRGREQCHTFARGLPAALEAGLAPQLVICSPFQRTLTTAALCLHSLPHDAAAWVSIETIRETLGRHTCDRRREITPEVERAHPRVQFHLLNERHDALWVPLRRETPEEILMRAQRLLDFIFDAQEDHVVLVAHSGIITALSMLFARPLDEADPAAAAAAESAEGTTSTDSSSNSSSSSGGAPARPASPHATTVADVQAYLIADGALKAKPIESRHCELMPFVVARLPLQSEKSKL